MQHYLALTVGGQQINPPSNLPPPGSATTITNNTLSLFVTAGIIIAVLFIIWAGIRWITSGGDKQKLAAARAHLTWAIIGLFIILLAFFIINLFSYFFGVNLLGFSN